MIDTATLRRQIAEHSAALAALGLAPIDDPNPWRRLATVGLFDCDPLARCGEARLIATRVLPAPESAAPLRPVVLVDVPVGETLQLSASPASLVPIWFILSLLHAPAARWRAWRDSDLTNSDLAALNASLGGKRELTALAALLDDEELEAAICSDLEGDLWTERLGDAFEWVAPDDARGPLHRTLRTIGRNGWEPDLDPGRLAGWESPLNLVLAAFGDPPDEAQLDALVRAGAGQPSAHDAGWLDLHGTPTSFGTARRRDGAPALIASAFVERGLEASGDPLSNPVRALAAAGNDYDGRAHLDAIRPLLESGDSEGAWNAALTAAFWIFQRRGSVPEEMMLMVGKLAREVDEDRIWPVVADQLRAMGAEL